MFTPYFIGVAMREITEHFNLDPESFIENPTSVSKINEHCNKASVEHREVNCNGESSTSRINDNFNARANYKATLVHIKSNKIQSDYYTGFDFGHISASTYLEE